MGRELCASKGCLGVSTLSISGVCESSPDCCWDRRNTVLCPSQPWFRCQRPGRRCACCALWLAAHELLVQGFSHSGFVRGDVEEAALPQSHSGTPPMTAALWAWFCCTAMQKKKKEIMKYIREGSLFCFRSCWWRRWWLPRADQRYLRGGTGIQLRPAAALSFDPGHEWPSGNKEVNV